MAAEFKIMKMAIEEWEKLFWDHLTHHVIQIWEKTYVDSFPWREANENRNAGMVGNHVDHDK